MDKLEDEHLSACVTKKASMPMMVQSELTVPLKCNTINEDFDSFKKAVAETIDHNIELFKELPPPRNFTLEQAINFLKSEVKKDIEKDQVFEKSVEIRKYANTMFESMEKYFKNVFNLHLSYKNKHSLDLFDISKQFLNSNLPELFLKTISTSYFVEADFIDLFDGKIRKEKLSLIANRNNRPRFERICEEHNFWVRDFTEKIEAVQRNRIKLVWYVDINNSNTVEELFKDKIIKIKLLDDAVLNHLIQTLEQTTSDLETLIIKNINAPCLPTTQINDGVKTITAMMKILN